jgi:hypothetical protein
MAISREAYDELYVAASVYRSVTRKFDHGSATEQLMDKVLRKAQAILNRERNGPMSQPSTGAILGQLTGTLALPSADQPLGTLVRAVVSEVTRRGMSFTAYDVTQFLRRYVGSARDIPHYTTPCSEGVRDLVHDQMTTYTLNGTYRTTTASPNGKDNALLFVPNRTAPPPVTLAQNAAANTPGSPRKSEATTPPATGSQQQLTAPPAGAWIVNSQKGGGSSGSSGSSAITLPVVTRTTAEGAKVPPPHWKKHNGITKGPGWTEVTRTPLLGRTTARIRHDACGHEFDVFVWSWAGHGSLPCPRCHQKVAYR